jgi:hypothetical protein
MRIRNINEISVGDKLRVITNLFPDIAPTGTIITVSRKDRHYIYAKHDGEEQLSFSINDVEHYSISKKNIENVIKKAKEEREKANIALMIAEGQLRYLEETKRKDLIPHEFKTHMIVAIMKDPNISEEEKNKRVGQLVESN